MESKTASNSPHNVFKGLLNKADSKELYIDFHFFTSDSNHYSWLTGTKSVTKANMLQSTQNNWKVPVNKQQYSNSYRMKHKSVKIQNKAKMQMYNKGQHEVKKKIIRKLSLMSL